MTRAFTKSLSGILALSLSLFLVAAASPASAAPWDGCYVGGAVGYGAAISDTAAVVPGVGTLVGIDGLGNDGASITGEVGCDMQLNKFVIGLSGEYTWDDMDSINIGVFPGLGGGTLGSASVDSRWGIYGRAGYLVTDNTLLYGKLGWTQMDLSAISSPLFGVSFPGPTFKGWSIGGGMETELRKNLYLDINYSFAQYDSESVTLVGDCPDCIQLTMDPDIHTARIGVKYKFNFGSQTTLTDPLK